MPAKPAGPPGPKPHHKRIAHRSGDRTFKPPPSGKTPNLTSDGTGRGPDPQDSSQSDPAAPAMGDEGECQ
jgi:hypothetical protein